MKKLILNNYKFFIGIITGIIISGASVYAVSLIASEVAYDNTISGSTKTNMQDAIDDLYSKANSRGRVITVYSAAGDTIYYYEESKKVELCATNSSGRGLCPIPRNGSVTLYSSVAKNPSNLSSPYSKTINITSSTKSIYLMPNDNILYWYGYNNGLETVNAENGWPISTYTMTTVDFDASNITTLSNNTSFSFVGGKLPKKASKVKCIAKPVFAWWVDPYYAANSLRVGIEKSFLSYTDYLNFGENFVTQLFTQDITNANEYSYVHAGSQGINGSIVIYAIWGE